MPHRYTKATQEVTDLIDEVMRKHHEPLSAVGVTIQALMAYAAENDMNEKAGPALSMGGYACNAAIRKTPLRERVMGSADAEIVFDGDNWGDRHIDEKRAIIDHELEHLTVSKKVSGEVILDTHGRPKLGMRLHDVQLGWFSAVAKRYGEASVEVVQAASLVQEHLDTYFPFAKVTLYPKQESLPNEDS